MIAAPRIPALSNYARRRCLSAGWALCAASIFLLPVSGGSGFVPESVPGIASLPEAAQPAHPVHTLPPIAFADPFVGDVPPSPAPSSSAQTGGVLLRAVVLGPAPRALVDENGNDRIVAAGDAVGGSILSAIGQDCIFLRDGRRIPMSNAPQ